MSPEIRANSNPLRPGWFRAHRWPLILTVSVFVLAAVGMIGTCFEIPRINPSPIWVLFRILGFFGLLLVPVIVAIWCSVVFQNPVRFLFAMLILMGPACWIALVTSFRREFNWGNFVFPFAVAISVVVALEGIKLIGRFRRMEKDELQASPGEALQFGIKHLFIALTVTAVLFGLRSQLFLAAQAVSGGRGLGSFPVISFSITMVAMAILSVWATLGSSIPIRLLMAFLLSAGLVGLLMITEPGFSRTPDRIIFVGIFSSIWLAMAMLLLMLRRVGYRFVKRTSVAR